MTVCLVISTYNRTPLLRKSLTRLAQLTIPDEVLVVDDGGDDGCEALCTELGAILPMRYIYTHQPFKAMCSHARNVGIKNTDCDLIMTAEPEMYFNTDIVAQFLAKHAERPNDMLNAGTVHHEHPDWNPPQTTTTSNWTATWVAMYERQWLLDVGGWDEHFPDPWGWDDTDLVTRICTNHHGCTIMLDAEATHQWHAESHQDQAGNEAHFRAKMSADGNMTGMQLVANAGYEWGVIKTR